MQGHTAHGCAGGGKIVVQPRPALECEDHLANSVVPEEMPVLLIVREHEGREDEAEERRHGRGGGEEDLPKELRFKE